LAELRPNAPVSATRAWAREHSPRRRRSQWTRRWPPGQQQPATEPGGPRWPGGVLRRLLDEDAALLAVYLDVPLGDVENRRG